MTQRTSAGRAIAYATLALTFAACRKGPTVIASSSDPVAEMAIDSSAAYWSTQGTSDHAHQDGEILRVPLAGGKPTTLAFSQPSPCAFAVDSSSVYWLTSWRTNSQSTEVEFNLRKVASSGGAVATLTTFTLSLGPLADFWDGSFNYSKPVYIDLSAACPVLAIDGASIYWASQGTLTKLSAGGGAPVTIATDGIQPLGMPGKALAIAGSTAFWVDGLSSVMKLPLGGGTPTPVATGQADPLGLAVDANNVYWINGGQSDSDGAVMKASQDGGAPVALATGRHKPSDIAVDAANVYWAGTNTDIMKVPLAGGAVSTAVPGAHFDSSLRVDSQSLYWISANNVMKAKK